MPHTPRQTGGSGGISQADISSCHALIKGVENHPDDWSLTSSIYITSPRLAAPFFKILGGPLHSEWLTAELRPPDDGVSVSSIYITSRRLATPF